MMEETAKYVTRNQRPLGGVKMRQTAPTGYRQPMNTSPVLRGIRRAQGRTLREVSSVAQVSLGYLSEVERGQKEASSELLEAITDALGVPLWYVLREVSDRMALVHGSVIPDTVPDDLVPVTLIS